MGTTTRILAAATLAVLAACTAAQGPPAEVKRGDGLDGDWQLVSLGDLPVHEGITPPTLFVAGDRVSGFAGVNRFTGARAEEGTFLFGPLATTRMAGPPPAMELETRYLAGLQQATGWRLEDGALVLLSGEAPVLRFRQKPAD